MKFDNQWIANPQYYAINRLKAHSDHKTYRDKACNENFQKSLNGKWKFYYAETIQDAPRGFSRPDYDLSSYDEITVPSHIQMSGYGRPQYTNTAYPWDGTEDIIPGQIPAFNPVGTYVLDLDESEFTKGSAYISFQGVESAFSLWMNGEFVGYSEDSFTPAEFELSSYIREGKNRIGVQVYKYSSGSWLEDQDFFRFSGIFREVYLFTKPKIHLEDIFVKTIADSADIQNSAFEIRLNMNFEYDRPGHYLAKYDLKAPNGEIVCSFDKEIIGKKRENEIVCSETLEKPDEYTDTASIRVQHPLLWSAEFPNLYQLTIQIMDMDAIKENVLVMDTIDKKSLDENAQDKLPIEVIVQPIGIRQFGISNSVMKLNGKRIVFNGVNRHEFCNEKGRILSFDQQRGDVITMKRNNINAVRTSHYPNSSVFYDLCDRYGIYMIDEANLETHGSVYRPDGLKKDERAVPADHPKWRAAVLDRANSMFERDKNHPSILLWSCGNESAGGKVIFDESELLRMRDETRVIHYEGLANDNSYPDTSDVVSRMYWKVPDIENYLKEHRDKPFISCEYAHSMGNSTGNLWKYTDLAKHNPLYQGGFIWDFVDQAIMTTAPDGSSYPGYGGDFGDRPHDADFSGNGILFSDRTPSPSLPQVKYDYQGFEIVPESDKFTIRNHTLFTDSKDYDVTVVLTVNGIEKKKDKIKTSVAPGGEAIYLLDYDAQKLADENKDGEYIVTITMTLREETDYAPAGFEIAFGQSEGFGSYQLGMPGNVRTDKPVLENCIYDIGIVGNTFHYMFRKGLVSLGSIRRMDGDGSRRKWTDAEEILYHPLRPNFWRAPVQNDTGNGMIMRQGIWKLISETAMCNPVEVRTSDDKSMVMACFSYTSPYYPAGELARITYEVCGDGLMKVTMQSEGFENMPCLPEYGVILSLPSNYEHLTWYGRGPKETYADRKSGSRIGLYQNLVRDNVSPYIMPQETGNHADTRYAIISDGNEKAVYIYSVDEAINVSVTPYTPQELENARHAFELPSPYETVVRISSAQMGVGGDDSWGAPVHEEFMIPSAGKKHLSFYFSLV